LTSEAADLETAMCVGGVNSDPDDITRTKAVGVERFEGLVGDKGVDVAVRRGGSQNEQPAWRDDSYPEGNVTGIDQVDAQGSLPPGCAQQALIR
jgi:hypothetical protein